MKKAFLFVGFLTITVFWGCRPGPSPFPLPEPVTSPTPAPLYPIPEWSPAVIQQPTATPSPLPSPSPSPSPILTMELLFHSERDGDHEIYLLDFFTRTLYQLTDNQVADAYPSWSPDRTKIAFVSERDGNPEIYVMEADGDNPIRLTDNQEPDGFPCWSPDGETIAFFSGQEAADNLCIMELSANKLRFLTDFEEGRGGATAFSPDGKKIVFGYKRLGKYKIYLVDLSDGESREIINNALKESRLRWTSRPDGPALLYVSGKGNQEDIWMLFVEDKRFKHITKNSAPDRSPCIASEGQEVIFSSQRDGKPWQLYLVSLEGEPCKNPVQRLTNDSFNYYYPDWK